MPRLPKRFLLLALLLLASIPVRGQGTLTSTASHTVRIGVQPISVIAVSGNPLPLTMISGQDAERISRDLSTHYNLTTNVDDVRIEASLDFPMPPGLRLRLRAETGLGRSRGFVNLNATGRGAHLVSGIGRGLENGRVLEYELVAEAGAGPIPMQERQVTIAIINPRTGSRQEIIQSVSFSVDDAFGFESMVNASN